MSAEVIISNAAIVTAAFIMATSAARAAVLVYKRRAGRMKHEQ